MAVTGAELSTAAPGATAVGVTGFSAIGTIPS